MYSLGQPPRLMLSRKPPLYWSRRFAGLCLTAAIAWVFVRRAISWILHPTLTPISSGSSPLPRGMARWDLLGLGLALIVLSIYLILRPEGSVRLMFSADQEKLRDRITLAIWTSYVRVGGTFGVLFSLMALGEFVASLK